jgi:hypothetical protein
MVIFRWLQVLLIEILYCLIFIIQNLKNLINEKNIYLIFYTTTDAKRKHMMCIMPGVCNPCCYSRLYFVKTLEAENGTADVAKSRILAAIYHLLGTDLIIYW